MSRSYAAAFFVAWAFQPMSFSVAWAFQPMFMGGAALRAVFPTFHSSYFCFGHEISRPRRPRHGSKTRATQSPCHPTLAAMSNLTHTRVGDRVKVTQQTPRQQGVITISVEGVVLRMGQQKTGSWYAHSKDDKLWLDRIELRKADGELVVLNLDRYTLVEPAEAH